MANNPLKRFKKLQSSNYDDKIKPRTFQKLQVKARRTESNFDNIQSNLNNKLKDLIGENEESFFQDEDINNISFELSNINDMDDLLDNFSNKSDEKIDLEFESTTNEEGIELIDDYLKESTKKIIESKKGFDKDVIKLTKEFYNDLINNLNIDETIKNKNLTRTISKEELIYYNDNNSNINEDKKNTFKRKSYGDSKSNMFSESITSDDNNTPKFKNYLMGLNDTGQTFGKVFSMQSKFYKSSSKYVMDRIDEDKKIESIQKEDEK